MKNTAQPIDPQTEVLLWDIAHLVSADWYRQAIRAPYAKFFLWYRKAKPGERIALPIVSVDAPNDEYTRSIQISNAWTTESAKRAIAGAMKALPILGEAK
jgi:hypothetical protein